MQYTIADTLSLTGTGIHSGKEVKISINPAGPSDGIYFVKQGEEGVIVQAFYANITDSRMCTTIGTNGFKVSTIEHLMAALFMCGIDNAKIIIDQAEVPILDGSADIWVKNLVRIGTIEQNIARNIIAPQKSIKVDGHAGSYISIEPYHELCIDYTIEHDHPALGVQNYIWRESDGYKNISISRTFGFAKDLEYLNSKGLALGASMENVVAIGETDILNPEGLRHTDEIVCHKIMDCIGDLYLCNGRIKGLIKAHKAGHYLHCALLKEIMNSMFAN